jgi:hypothetical protein
VSEFYTPDSSGSAASKFGQMIGEAFEQAVLGLIQDYLTSVHPHYEILAPDTGRQIIALKTFGGTPRQIDAVIAARDSNDPVALLETKWLKDARHHNDKGAWILQLREIRKQYATVRGAAAILAGYWTEGVGVLLDTNAGIRMILVATDEEVYRTLQMPLNDYLRRVGAEPFTLDSQIMRKRYPRAYDLANFLLDLHRSGRLGDLARQWLYFERARDARGQPLYGADRVKQVLDELLAPPPSHPQIQRFEIALQIETGNVIYEEFTDIESAMEFMRIYYANPDAIRDRISPRSKNNDPGIAE